MRITVVITVLVLLPFIGYTQKTDSLIKKLDSLVEKKDSAGGQQQNNITPEAYNENTALNFKSYFILLGSDLKQDFTKPFHMKRRDWGYVAKFAVVTGALMFADKPIQRRAEKITPGSSFATVSKYVTNFGGLYEAYTLAALGATGIIFKIQKLKTTTLLATQAYLAGAAIESVMKLVSGRKRPSAYFIEQDAKPTFTGPFSKSRDANGKYINSSFPSGHTTVAFAAATVFALEYKTHLSIKILSYSAASLIGVSRITENKHWISDVLVGAAIGYLTGKQIVNNYHRYAKLKAPRQPGNTVSFNLNYNFGHVMPGVTYKFR